jgi:integrase/recombinase XerD
MKSLPLSSEHYQYLEKSYQQYLQVLGYASTTVGRWPICIRELLYFLEQQNIVHIAQLETCHLNDFVTYLRRRNTKKRGAAGALSTSSVNYILNAVNIFIKYLNSTGKYLVESIADREKATVAERIILTIDQIKQLYQATFLPQREHSIAMGQRDRVIIAIFYGCGLRKSEGLQLNISDIDLDRKLLFVRKGKGNKQRYVPIAGRHLHDIKEYLQQGREWFLYKHYAKVYTAKYPKRKVQTDEDAFFLSQHGRRMYDCYPRLALMCRRAELNKHITLHALRHSIATHLLQSGMDIEAIAKFLGHASLDSTQIYTHIVNEIPALKGEKENL